MNASIFELVDLKDEQPKKDTTVLVSFKCSETTKISRYVHDCVAYINWNGKKFIYRNPSKTDSKFKDGIEHYIDGMFRNSDRVKVIKDSIKWFKKCSQEQ